MTMAGGRVGRLLVTFSNHPQKPSGYCTARRYNCTL